MKKSFSLFLLFFILQTGITSAQEFARGADIGWLSEMENSGKVFLNDNGEEQDVLDILADHCINSIRLRVWVNPENGWSAQQDVINLATRAKNKGFRIMIDFHYSDNWADPGKQFKPQAWESYSTDELNQAVYNHTFDVLTAIKNAGITPEWVQIGNETNDGMLWEDGRASVGNGMANYASFVSNGNNAAKTVFPNIITIVHVANGFDNGLFTWNIGGLISNGAQFDAIGMSLYPDPDEWETMTSECLTNMQDMVNRYNKKVVISEIGMSWTAENEAKAFVEDIIAKNMSLPNNMGLGVFWWEPQTFDWRGYDKGAWNTNGRPTIALDGFLTNCNPQITDCNGDIDGSAYVDDCGTCVSGNTNIDACSPVNVTFKVNMASVDASQGVYITGTMLDWQITAMNNEGNNIYSYTLQMNPSDTGAYYFLNANNWENREIVPLQCVQYWDSDRGFTVPDYDITYNHNWESCDVITATTVRETQFNISPNPFHSNLRLSASSEVLYSILNTHGERIANGSCITDCNIGENLAKGIYFLKLQTEESTFIQKIVKD